jgi:hypothetical protein
MKPSANPSALGRDRVRIEKIDHQKSVRKEVTCPDRKSAGSDEGIEFLNVRGGWVRSFLHDAQYRCWRPGTAFGQVFDQRDQPL